MKTRLLIIIVLAAVGFFTFVTIQSLSVSHATSIFDACYDDDECTIDKLYKLSPRSSSQTMLLTIDNLVDLYVDANFYCHPAAHHMGEFLYGYLGRDLELASDLSDYRCASGIMHGLIENVIQIENILDGRDIESVDIKESCDIIETSLGVRAKNECAHGMGHSIIKIYDYDTTKAVQRCNEFDDKTMKYMCNGGLFMQNMNEYSKTRGGDFVDSSWYYPCNNINATENGVSAAMCYRYHANYFLSKTSYDLQSAQSLCMGINDKNYIPICIKGISAHLAKNNFNDLDTTKLMCDTTPTKYKESCIKGAIESLTRFVSEEKAAKFCESFDGEFQVQCQNRMNSLLDSRYGK